MQFCLSLLIFAAVQDALFFRQTQTPIMSMEEIKEGRSTAMSPPPTLREYLNHPDGFHMAFAPAFFGFFAYFGALAALEEETNGRIVPRLRTSADTEYAEEQDTACCGLKSVAGASAGAMAAVMLAAGIQPREAAEFACTVTWGMVSDPPGLGGYVKGKNFEERMRQFIFEAANKIRRHPPPVESGGDEGGLGDDGECSDSNDVVVSSMTPIQLEEALVPVAVSGFDLLCMRGMNLSKGCMAKAARSSAGFPGLFQPVAWREESSGGSNDSDSNDNKKKPWLPDALLIDGGITDGLGLNGLGSSCTEKKNKIRVINMVVGDFGYAGPSGIKSMPPGVNASSLVSIALVGTPMCGPWAMENGPWAFESARRAMVKALDAPMERARVDDGSGNQHYVLRVDSSK